MTRAQFGEVSVAMPSRSSRRSRTTSSTGASRPATSTRAAGGSSRALNGRRPGGFGGSGTSGGSRYGDDLVPLPRRDKPAGDIAKFANRIPAKVRDNGEMELAPGDRIRHEDFGEGRVDQVTGEGAKRVAHVRFDRAGQKKLLIKIAPIEKL
jgi:DNA helicase-2/ATP-dependent DNA helicase PcrA